MTQGSDCGDRPQHEGVGVPQRQDGWFRVGDEEDGRPQ